MKLDTMRSILSNVSDASCRMRMAMDATFTEEDREIGIMTTEGIMHSAHELNEAVWPIFEREVRREVTRMIELFEKLRMEAGVEASAREEELMREEEPEVID